VGDGSYNATNLAATTNPADPPFLCGLNVGNDLWYNYTASGTGNLTVDTCGSLFDTVLELHVGHGCPPGASLGCVDNSVCGAVDTLQSSLAVPVTQGDQIKIRVGGWDGEQGQGVLNIACEPMSIGPP
jgi:hypothetical protein